MTTDDKKLLDIFEARLRHLFFLFDELKMENTRLKQEITGKKEEIEILKSRLAEVERNYSNLKVARTISLNNNELKATKRRLSQLVREVDKCIDLLNE
ncbi:MAG: hypothetical protein LUE93_10215 [Bacteroides sp.]|nr:hypothetical protein [Bacteroides sp.]